METVLIVDDDYYFNVDTLGYHLERIGGYKVLSAFTVEEFKKLGVSGSTMAMKKEPFFSTQHLPTFETLDS